MPPHFTINSPYRTKSPIHAFNDPFAYSFEFTGVATTEEGTNNVESTNHSTTFTTTTATDDAAGNLINPSAITMHFQISTLSLHGPIPLQTFEFISPELKQADITNAPQLPTQLPWFTRYVDSMPISSCSSPQRPISSQNQQQLHFQNPHHHLVILFQNNVLFLHAHVAKQYERIHAAAASNTNHCNKTETIQKNHINTRQNSCHWKILDSDYGRMTCMTVVCSQQQQAPQQQLFIGTANGYLLILNLANAFDGNSSTDVSVSQIASLDFLPQQRKMSLGIQSLLWSESMRVFVIALQGSGSIMLCRMTQSQYDPEQYNFVKVMSLSGSAVALSERNQLLAVGLMNGDVKLLDYRPTSSTEGTTALLQDEASLDSSSPIPPEEEIFTLRCILSLRKRGGYHHSQLFIGKPLLLKFSHDGCAVAVSYEDSGMAIFDSSGVCLMSCQGDDGKEDNSSGSSGVSDYTTGATEAAENRQISAATASISSPAHAFYWNLQNTKLFVLSPRFTTIYDIVKSAQLTNMSEPFQNAVLLHGADRLMLFRLTTEGFFKTHWEHLMFQEEYVRNNYPIRHVATSRNGQNIVVAGTHGCAVYNDSSRKWRLFGNQHQEKQISCSTITWINDDLICLVDWNQQRSTSTIYLYPRFHLDNSSLIASLSVCKKRIIHASYARGLLFLYDQECNLHTIEINVTNGTASILASISLQETTGSHCVPVKAMMALKYHTRSNVRDRTCLFLHEDRRLTAYFVNYSEEVLLHTNVHNFWIEMETQKELIYFVYTQERGVQLCIQDVTFLDRPRKQRCTIYFDNLVEFDVDKCPMGILQEYGTFVHASMATHEELGKKVFDVQAHTYPYAHVIILYKLICQQNPVEALDYANQYVEKSSFEAILDWLLFFVLSDEKIRVHYNGVVHEIRIMDHLEAVVGFLKKYDSQFYISVVNCLRKVDFGSCGQLLLHATGFDSKHILQVCLNRNLISSAVNMLRIVQQEHSLKTSLSCAYSLVKPLLQSEKYELLYELVVFINKMEYELRCSVDSDSQGGDEGSTENNTEKSGHSSTQRNTHITESNSQNSTDNNTQNTTHNSTHNTNHNSTQKTTPPSPQIIRDWLDDNVQLQILVSKHFAKILSTGHLSSLLQACTNLMTPIDQWLKHQIRHTRSIIEIHKRWNHYFSQIHCSFGLPRCSNITSGFMFSKPKEIEKRKYFVFFTITQDRLFTLSHLKDEITILWKMFDEAQCVEWSILLATLLCEVDYIVKELRRNPYLWPAYRSLLNHPHNMGYKRLLDYMERNIE